MCRFAAVLLTVLCAGNSAFADTIATSHEIELKNGQLLRADVSDDSDERILVLTYGKLGTVRLDRSTVARVTTKAGRLSLQTSRKGTAKHRVVDRSSPDDPARTVEMVSGEIDSREIANVGPAAPELSAERQAEIDHAIRELGRWRTRNRVRAERQLAAIGQDSVDSLISIANDHPFNLTRRAVFRLFAKLEDERTVPAAFVALTDSDRFVRSGAVELLRNMTGRKFRFDPDGYPNLRRNAIKRWAVYLAEREAAQAKPKE